MEQIEEKYYDMSAEEYSQEKWKETGKRIKEACREAGYNVSDISLALGLASKSFYKIIYGEVECKTKYLYEIAQYTGVSVDYLLFGYTGREEYDEIINICQNISSKDMERVKKVLQAFVD